MIRFFFIIIIIVLSQYSATSQMETANWICADSVGLSFNTPDNMPKIIRNELYRFDKYYFNQISTISDKSGNLLLFVTPYKRGVDTLIDTVFDRNGDIIPNSFIKPPKINNNGLYTLFLKKPGYENIYYFLYLLFDLPTTLNTKLHYLVIEINEITGKGSIIQSDKLVSNYNMVKGIAATYHNNGKDIWIITHRLQKPEYYSFLLTSEGIDTIPVISYSKNSDGKDIKISPDGKK